jgi:arylsulfatase A-like enzyme
LKRDVWEGGHRTPFIVAWPGTIPGGRESSRLISQTDIFATIADLLDVELEADCAEDSFSLPATSGRPRLSPAAGSPWKGSPAMPSRAMWRSAKAMSLALVGLRVPGILIRDPECTDKTYPDFFEDLRRVCQNAG